MNTTSITVRGVVSADGRLEITQLLDLPPGPVEVTVQVVAVEDNGRTGSDLPESSEPQIIERERGPCIAGTRITVYSILDYYKEGWDPSSIALTLGLSSAQVLAAIRYIEEHKEEVLADYQTILEREARGNPPELQAKLDAIHVKWQAVWAEKRRQAGTPEANSEGTPGRQ
jgi:uncharacterized protein (DUF433 family)